jgi:hypothetical protein
LFTGVLGAFGFARCCKPISKFHKIRQCFGTLLNGERPNLGGDGFNKLFFACMRAQCIKVFLDLIQLDPFVKI